MQRLDRVAIVVLIVAGLLFSACGPLEEPGMAEPARVEPIAGSDLSRIVLTEKAVERLGIETAPVREEMVERKRIVHGQVERVETPKPDDFTAPKDSAVAEPEMHPRVFEETGFSSTLVRVSLAAGDAAEVDRSRTVVVVPLDDDDWDDGLTAELDEGLDDDDPEDGDVGDDDDGVLYYTLNGANRGLVPGQRVRVEIAMVGSGIQKLIIPYTAVFYGLYGDTWTYTNPEPLTYIRHPIVVDYIEGERAVLSEGPSAGTEVVTVGALELYGTELGLGN